MRRLKIISVGYFKKSLDNDGTYADADADAYADGDEDEDW
jgi:hypothetical protein